MSNCLRALFPRTGATSSSGPSDASGLLDHRHVDQATPAQARCASCLGDDNPIEGRFCFDVIFKPVWYTLFLFALCATAVVVSYSLDIDSDQQAALAVFSPVLIFFCGLCLGSKFYEPCTSPNSPV